MSATDCLNEDARNLVEALRKVHSDLTAYRGQLTWRFHQGDSSRAHEKDFDDSTWETRTLPTSWDPTLGDAWFRLVVPDSVSGIKVGGSKVDGMPESR